MAATDSGADPPRHPGNGGVPKAKAADEAADKTADKAGNSGADSANSRSSGRSGRNVSGRNVYSAIDLGTNNCRLLVARPVKGGFKIIDAFSRIVRLGEGIATTGSISEDAMGRAIEALKICAAKIERRGVTQMRHVATEACRAADNGAAFIARVKAETGLVLDIITPAEEARLAVLGCQTLLDRSARRAVVFDIGGGSTEVILVSIGRNGDIHILDWTSVPLGVVNLSEHYSGAEAASYFGEMVEKVRPYVGDFAARTNLASHIARHETQLLGTSGTVTTLASMHLGLERYDRTLVDGLWMDVRAIREITRILASKTVAERAAIPSIGPERAHFVIAGSAILEALLDTVDVTRLRIADRGIREGMLRAMMRRDPLLRDRSGSSPRRRNSRRRKPAAGKGSEQ